MNRRHRGFASRSQRDGMFAQMERNSAAYLRTLGYASKIIEASFDGGVCGLSGLKIIRGTQIAKFREYGWCLTPKIDRFIQDEAEAKLPRCGCGKTATNSSGMCDRCDYIAETREPAPRGESV